MRARSLGLWAILLAGLVVTLVLSSCSNDPKTAAALSGPQPSPPWRDVRGIIHAHSIYSHDACDNQPVGNTECLMQLREAICTTGQDYLMLSDHRETFAEHEFPDVLLYLPDEGDELVQDEQGRSYANLIPCPDGSAVTLLAGTENDIMPVHLHRHPPGSTAERHALYRRNDPAVVQPLRDLGASVIVSHSEGWSPQELIDFAPDGIEVFNLHAAIDPDLRPLLGVVPWGFLADLVPFLIDPLQPDPDLVIMTFWPRTTAWTERWDALLAVQRCYGVAATDAHRNTLPFPLSDGDRGDSYRRMMQFFSNHLLVQDSSPAAIEAALDSGRGYVAFDFLGLPVGFAFYATGGPLRVDMGGEVQWQPGTMIHVERPESPPAEPAARPPTVSARLIRIDGLGSAVVAQGEDDLEYEVPPGAAAYRAEIHMVPHHLEPVLGNQAGGLIREYPWIYGNPIYVQGP